MWPPSRPAEHTPPCTPPPLTRWADLLSIVGDRSQVVTVIDDQGASELDLRKIDARNDSSLLRHAATAGQQGIYTPHVAHELPLSDIVEAHTLAEHGNGKVVVTLA